MNINILIQEYEFKISILWKSNTDRRQRKINQPFVK